MGRSAQELTHDELEKGKCGCLLEGVHVVRGRGNLGVWEVEVAARGCWNTNGEPENANGH